MEYTKEKVLSLISRIHTLGADFTKRFLMEKGGFSSSHGFILYWLSAEPELTMGELSERINRDKSTTTILVKKLSDEGLVEVFPSGKDSRKRLVRLTQKGREFIPLTEDISKTLMKSCYRDFSEEEKDTLLALLKKLCSNLENA